MLGHVIHNQCNSIFPGVIELLWVVEEQEDSRSQSQSVEQHWLTLIYREQGSVSRIQGVDKTFGHWNLAGVNYQCEREREACVLLLNFADR